MYFILKMNIIKTILNIRVYTKEEEYFTHKLCNVSIVHLYYMRGIVPIVRVVSARRVFNRFINCLFVFII